MPKVGAIDVELGKRLRFFREQNNFSQERLAREIGVVFQQVQKYEAGVNRISCARLLKILSVLNISLVDFFAGICVDEKVWYLTPNFVWLEVSAARMKMSAARF